MNQQNYLTEHQSLADYYTKSEVDAAIENVEVDVDLTGYATEEWVKNRDYLTKYTERLVYYYKKSEVDEMMATKLDTNKIWSGTQAEWDAMTATQQNSYTIAMIEIEL